jgi:hypothetical protein
MGDMVAKKTTTGKKAGAKLNLRKETVRNLDVKNSSGVKGGAFTGTCLKVGGTPATGAGCQRNGMTIK